MADTALALMARKDALQAELDSQYSILSNNQCTMNSPLVDPEGFPRADIDVYAVRHARVRIIELRNDMTKLMDDIGKALANVHSTSNTASAPAAVNGAGPSTGVNGTGADMKPFARVDGVFPGSPASDAGLQRGDLVVQFDSLVASSFPASTLGPLTDVVGSHENRQLIVKVLREGAVVSLRLTPRHGWGGRGLLGCHLVPHSAQ